MPRYENAAQLASGNNITAVVNIPRAALQTLATEFVAFLYPPNVPQLCPTHTLSTSMRCPRGPPKS